MSINATMIQMMVDKGLSAQDIADIAKASEARTDHTAAERQARHRAKKKARTRNAVTSRRDPPIERNHTPGSGISPSGENQNDCAIRDADWPDLPEWLPPKPWNAFLEMRQDKGAWPSPHAVELMVGKLERWRAQGHDLTDILNTSTECNWTGLFQPKGRNNDRQSPRNDEIRNPYAREVARRQAERAGAESG